MGLAVSVARSVPALFPPRLQEGAHAQEVAQFQAELSEARTQLQLLQQQLDEQLSKQPVGNQEVMLGTALHPAHRTEGWALCLSACSGTGIWSQCDNI